MADAGYESLANYLYLDSTGQACFIKPMNYDQKKGGNFKKQIGRVENMEYDPEEDCSTCANVRKLTLRRECMEKKDGRFVATAWYRCESCAGCPCRAQCCRAKDPEQPKALVLQKTFWEKRAQAAQRITSERGIHLRLCRSIQVEGAFSLLKNELLYLQKFESMEQFKAELIAYLDYYNNRRTKAKLKGLPPAIHRQQALLAA